MSSVSQQRRGFTLIELLVVIAIIGILSSVVLASLNSARRKGRDARRISDLKQLALALDLYYDANSQTYPIGAVYATTLAPLTAQNFISSLPVDPVNSGTSVYTYASANADGTACVAPATNCASYVLRAVIEAGAAATPQDVDGTVAAVDCVDPNYCVRP